MGNDHDAPRNESIDSLAYANLRKREEALREYYYTQDIIGKFAESALKIKSWSITSCGIALGFGISEQRPTLFCLAAFGSLVFWYLEGMWKKFEYIAIERSHEIERLLSGNIDEYSGPKINEHFAERLEKEFPDKDFVKIMLYKNVRIPHFYIFAVGMLMFLSYLLNAELHGFFNR
jgi:hypothetical protein